MPSTLLEPIATKLKELAGTIADPAGDPGDFVKSFVWAPRETDKRPAAVVELPAVRRTPVDAREDHLGANDWYLTYPVSFYFDLSGVQVDQSRAAEVIEAWIKAVDANQDLDVTVQEAKVVEVLEPEFVEGDPRPVLRWRTRVQVLTFV